MIEQIVKSDSNALALGVVGSFTEADELYCQKLFKLKQAEGHDVIHVLIKLDEMKVSQSSAKAFFEDILWTLRNYKYMGHIAIVAHSKVLKALVPIDNLFFERASKGRKERYFDVSELEEALTFVHIQE